MKRRLASLLLAGTLALSLAACSGQTPPSPPPSAPVPASPTPEITAAPEAAPTPSPTPTPALTPAPEPTPSPLPEPSEEPEEGAWRGVEEPSSFGMPSGSDCPLVVSLVRTEEDGLTVALLPGGDEAAFTAFREADERIPHTEVTYDAGAGALILRLEDTTLASGEVTGDDWVFDFMAEHGMRYPVDTPAGAIPGGQSPLFEKAAISSDGAGTTISLLLSVQAAEYRVERGLLDGDEMRPCFRLVLRAAE